MTSTSNAPQAENLEGAEINHAGRDDHHQDTTPHPYGSAPVEEFLDALTAAGHPVLTFGDRFPAWKGVTGTDGNRAAITQHREAPGAHLAAVMAPGAFAVLDVDPRNGGDAPALRDALAAAGVPVYAEVHTGGAGTHYYVPSPARPTGDKIDALPEHPGVDVKTTGLVFLPGTMRTKDEHHDDATGRPRPYRLAWSQLVEGAGDADGADRFADWLDTHLTAPAPPQPAPAASSAPARPDTPSGGTRTEKYLRAALDAAAHRLATTTTGGRNRTLNNEALGLGHYAHHGVYTEAEARAALLAAAQQCGLVDEDGPEQCAATFASGWHTGAREPRDLPAPRQEPDTADPWFTPSTSTASATGTSSTTAEPRGSDDPRTPDQETRGQTRIAYRFAAHHTGRLLHVHGLGWHQWDGARWAVDVGDAHAQEAVIDTLRAANAESLGDDKLRKDIDKCWGASGIEGVLKIAAALPAFRTSTDDLDADPHLLNVQNGTVELHSMTLRPHDPADRITKVTPAAWDPDAPAPTWHRFLARSLPDVDVRAFLARYVGQALIGKVQEQRLLINTGEGGNGKSVWAEALATALGDQTRGGYAYTAPADMLIAAKNRSTFDGTVELRGARWAVLSETEKGRELAVSTVKRLTGGDPITARQLYKPLITFRPSHTIAMLANDPPQVPDTGHAIWRRVLVVPWTVVIPEHEQDNDLGDKLAAEADAVLAWALAGLADYQRQGLNPPGPVQIATTAYREESDDVAQFLSRCTQRLPGQSVGTKELHDRYREWAFYAEKTRTLGRDQFGKELERHKTSHQLVQGARRRWQNLALRPDWQEQNP